MTDNVIRTIKIVIGFITISVVIGAMVYGFASDNCTLAILIILVIRFFIPLLRVNTEE